MPCPDRISATLVVSIVVGVACVQAPPATHIDAGLPVAPTEAGLVDSIQCSHPGVNLGVREMRPRRERPPSPIRSFTGNCALLENGQVWCWGRDLRYGLYDRGLLPDDIESCCIIQSTSMEDNILRRCLRYPTLIGTWPGARFLAGGGGVVYVVLDDGRVVGWGTPVIDLPFGNGEEPRAGEYLRDPVTLPYLRDVRSLSFGYSTCAVVGDEGSLWCRGRDILTNSHPLVPTLNPVIGGGVAEVRSFASTTCARMRDGTVRCWGRNTRGELGLGYAHCTVPDRDPYVQRVALEVPGLRDIIQMAGPGSALRRDGTLWVWPEFFRGNLPFECCLGRCERLRPRRLNLDGVVRYRGSGTNGCAVRTDGTLWCWRSRQWEWRGLGNAPIVESPPLDEFVIEQQPGYRDVVDFVGPFYSGGVCALVRDGRLLCHGENSYGSLGDGTTHDRETPAPVLW